MTEAINRYQTCTQLSDYLKNPENGWEFVGCDGGWDNIRPKYQKGDVLVTTGSIKIRVWNASGDAKPQHILTKTGLENIVFQIERRCQPQDESVPLSPLLDALSTISGDSPPIYRADIRRVSDLSAGEQSAIQLWIGQLGLASWIPHNALLTAAEMIVIEAERARSIPG